MIWVSLDIGSNKDMLNHGFALNAVLVVGVDLILCFGYPLDEGEDCSTNEIAKVDHGFT